MGTSKNNKFNLVQNDIAEVSKVLSNPARVAILQYLLAEKECFSGEIAKAMPLAQPTVSQHLKELKSIGLVLTSIEGSRVKYSIHEARWVEVWQMYRQLFSPGGL